MSSPKTFGELVRFARETAITDALADPYPVALDTLEVSEEDERDLVTLCSTLKARTLLQALRHPRADAVLDQLVSPVRAAGLRRSLFAQLVAFAGVDDDDDDDDDEEEDDPGVLGASVPVAWRVAAANEPRPAPIAAAPLQLEEVRRWAAAHGVTERLSDPIAVLAPLVYGGDAHLVVNDGKLHTVADAFAPPAPAPKRAQQWEVNYRQLSAEALRTAARYYLNAVATQRAAVLSRRKALELRAQPPADPNLKALLARLEAARAELSVRVAPRPLGTYDPQSAHLEEAPLRIVYAEGANLRFGVRQVRVVIPVEEEPLRAACSCPEGQAGICTHELDALDAAIDLVRDPKGDAPRLAAILATPVWQRFLRAFSDELVLREAPAAADDARLAWRVVGNGAAVMVEPLLQKRLKSGGWSQGGRVRPDELAARRGLLADPHDARVHRALTVGVEDVTAAHRTVSRGRTVHVLEALIGHPRVFVEGKPGTPVRVARERLRVALEAAESGVLVSFFVGARRHAARELLTLAAGSDQIVDVDAGAGAVALCALDERALALLAAFEKHPARFPPESHEELLRGLTALQESVDLTLPEALAGEPVEGDARPVVRLSPHDSGEVEVEVLVRPVEGGPVFPPGEGPPAVLHAHQGRRVTARRDLAREASSAAVVVGAILGNARERSPTSPTPASSGEGGGEASAWTHLLDEEAALDLLAALRDLGDAVVVEWPEPEKRLSLASSVSRKELRIRVTDRRDWFGVEGEVEVDGASIPLAELLSAVRHGRRYVKVGQGRFAAIEDELRRHASAADDVLHPGRKGLEVALPGVALIEELAGGGGHLQAAARWRGLVSRLDAARTLEPVLPAGLGATLRPYQLEGFRWLVRLAAWGAGACLADDMGLGKTVQALALLLSRAERGPALVIAPTSVGPNWIREAERFASGLRARLYRGPGRAALLAEARPGDLLVTSYALATRDAEALGQARFATLVLDEAQAIKNSLTRRARAISGIDAELRVALTGTPVENHLGELWSLMRVLTPGLLGSWDHFRDRFAGPIERDHSASRSAALSRLVRPFLLRRTKAEVAPELPPRTEMERFVDLSAAERRLYDEARRAALESLATGGGDARFAILAALMRLRRLACHPRLQDDGSGVPSSKLAALLEIVDELREEGHRALVFSQFTSHLALVREALDAAGVSYQYLDGGTPSEERTRRIDAFQGGQSDLFLISLKAGGTGLNLTAADYVIHLDPWWNPAVEDQATDRAHRIGQTRPVTVIRLIARGTIEEAVLSLHRDKRALAASVFDEEGSPARLSAAELAALIRAGSEDAPGEDEGDGAGDEVVPAAAAPVAKAPKKDLVAKTSKKDSPPPAPSPRTAEQLVSRLIEHLAEQRGGVDPRYDPTLRTYARSLQRFVGYLQANDAATEPNEAVIDDYLAAVSEGRWPTPASEKGLARTVMNHLKAFLRRPRAAAGGPSRGADSAV